jgi:ADP-ribose pyrophosphatase
MERHEKVRVLESELIHRGRVFDVLRESVLLPSGLRQELDVIDHGGAVCVAARADDGRLWVVRQYRHAAGEWLEEIPAGRLERDEDPLAAARRALEEATGRRAARWSELTSFFAAPGFCSEVLHLFLAEELEEVPGGGLPADADEEIELVLRSPAELLARARDAKTLLAAALLSLDPRGTSSASTK